MPENFQLLLEHLLQFNLFLRHKRDIAEAAIPDFNTQIRRLYESRFIGKMVLVGDVILHRPYDPDWGTSDSGQVVVAVLGVPGGIGCCYFDTEELYGLRKIQNGVESAALEKLVAFESADPHAQARLLDQVQPLIEQFIRIMDLK